MIDSLKALALCKLHKSLCAFKLEKSNAEDFIDLVRYAYCEEGERESLKEGLDP